MPVTRGRTKAVSSASATPTTVVSPVFSGAASIRSTPDTSVMDEDDTVLKQEVTKTTKTNTVSKKRVLEDVSEAEDGTPSTKRGAKRRVVQQTAYVEIATNRVSKVNASAFLSSSAHLKLHVQTASEASLSGNRRSSRASAAAAAIVVEDSDNFDESDDSGSEFDPAEDNAGSDFADDLDESDEEALVETVVKQSLRTAREDRERAAGLVSAGAGSSKSATRAALPRAGGRRRSMKEVEVIEIDSTSELEFEELSALESDESEEEPLSKGKAKNTTKNKGKNKEAEEPKPLTKREVRKMSKEERKMHRLRQRGLAKEEAEMRVKLGRKLTRVRRSVPLRALQN